MSPNPHPSTPSHRASFAGKTIPPGLLLAGSRASFVAVSLIQPSSENPGRFGAERSEEFKVESSEWLKAVKGPWLSGVGLRNWSPREKPGILRMATGVMVVKSRRRGEGFLSKTRKRPPGTSSASAPLLSSHCVGYGAPWWIKEVSVADSFLFHFKNKKPKKVVFTTAALQPGVGSRDESRDE